MSRIIYITRIDCNDKSHKGFEKKVNSQVKAFINNGDECDLVFLRGHQVILKNGLNNQESILFEVKNKYEKNIKLYDLIRESLDNLLSYDIYYFRYQLSNRKFIDFCRYLRKNNKKVLVEIVTYPYHGELTQLNFLTLVKKYMDIYYRRYLSIAVDHIVTFSEDKIIFNTPCINIANGIDLDKIKLINPIQNKQCIVFTSVSACEYWHGIDRFLSSLVLYGENNPQYNILFNIIGEGRELEKLREIVNSNEYLKKVVKFRGYLTGKELDEIYDNTNIAVGSLGRFRTNINTMRALKNCEYAAKGLPMIYSEDDPGFRNVEFVYKVPHNESSIDIKEILDWYSSLTISKEDIRKYSERFSWTYQMKKVINNI